MPSVRDSPRSHDLYRFYDADDRLLYVGISLNAAQRASQHKVEKPWWDDVRRMDVEHLGLMTRSEAEMVERGVIVDERPLHNIAHNTHRNQIATDSFAWLCEVCGTPIEDGDGYIEMPVSERQRYACEMQEWKSLRPEVDHNASESERLMASIITAEQLLSIPAKAHWWAIHRSCDPNISGCGYWIDVGRMRTQVDVLRWTSDLMLKHWFIHTDWGELIRNVAAVVVKADKAWISTDRTNHAFGTDDT